MVQALGHLTQCFRCRKTLLSLAYLAFTFLLYLSLFNAFLSVCRILPRRGAGRSKCGTTTSIPHWVVWIAKQTKAVLWLHDLVDHVEKSCPVVHLGGHCRWTTKNKRMLYDNYSLSFKARFNAFFDKQKLTKAFVQISWDGPYLAP